ncbi:MAG: hypothetical protein ACFCUE_03190 [Candidatus Bathyarchaeia archaeon]
MSTRKTLPILSTLTLAAFILLMILFLSKPGDSDIWWYGVFFQIGQYHNSSTWLHGAVTGVFGWLFLALLAITAILFHKQLKKKE